jgi:Tol biopolymer transport system component
VPLTRLAGTEVWPTFAPDGEQVAFAWSGEKDDNSDIYVTLVGSAAVRRLTTDPSEDYAPSWSPDGHRIAFLRKVGNAARIHVVSALGGPDSQVSDFPVGATPPESLSTVLITWSPDGRFVAAGRDPRSAAGVSAGIYLIPIDGGEARAMTRPTPPAFHFSPIFSPDGRHLAYAACHTPGLDASTLMPGNCSVAGVEVDERMAPVGTERNLAAQPVHPAGMAWSRDSRSLVFVSAGSNPESLWRLWIDGTRPPQPVLIAGSQAAHPATVASRDRLVFSQFGGEAHLYRFNAGRAPELVAASSSYEDDSDFSPDGRRIAFRSGRSGSAAIWVAEADGSQPRQLTSHQWGWQGSPNWSPDGRSIAFDAHDRDGHVHVWTIPAEGGAPRRVTIEAGDQTAPTWSRDGKWIYFSDNRAGGRDIWRVPAAGGPASRVTLTGAGFRAYEAGDGTALLYQPKYGDSPLLVMPLTGAGAPRPLVDCVRAGAFTIRGHTIWYVACESGSTPPLRSHDMVTGRDRLLGTLEHFPPDTLGVSLAVSPDGKTILFRELLRRGADLMLVENFR